MIKIAVSACLLGRKVRYDGKSKPNKEILEFLEEMQGSVEAVPICPEVSGGLPVPRPPSEIIRRGATGSGDSDMMNGASCSGDSDMMNGATGSRDSDPQNSGIHSGDSDPKNSATGSDGSDTNRVRVINSEGRDVTIAYEKGASDCLGIIKENGIKIAVLKARSPACGKDQIYDGTFSKKLVSGSGVLARELMDEGIEVFTEEEFDAFKKAILELC